MTPHTVWQRGREASQARLGGDGLQELLRLARDAIERGHRRVATQRLLMLRACDAELPDEFVQYSENVLETLPRWQRQRMHRAASDWAKLCGSGAPT